MQISRHLHEKNFLKITNSSRFLCKSRTNQIALAMLVDNIVFSGTPIHIQLSTGHPKLTTAIGTLLVFSCIESGRWSIL